MGEWWGSVLAANIQSIFKNLKSNTPTNFHPPIISPKASTNLREYFTPGVIWKSMDSLIRKRNVSDGDSGFDSALSSRSSSISLDESPEFGKLFHEDEELLNAKLYFPTLKDKFSNILTLDEDIRHDDETDDLFVIFNQVTGAETLYKPPSRLKFCQTPSYSTTYSMEEYNRGSPIPRSKLFHSRLEYELEKQVANMDMVEVDLTINNDVSPPPSLGIRVVGVNMIHGVQDKLNIYVKKVVDDSLAGKDGRILVNDHIIEVNGISLAGVSQKLAAQTLSNCAISPDTGTVHFVLARPRHTETQTQGENNMKTNKCDETNAVLEKKDKNISTTEDAAAREEAVSGGDTLHTTPTNAFVGPPTDTFEGRHAVRLRSYRRTAAVELSRFSKQLVIFGSLLLVSTYVTACKK